MTVETRPNGNNGGGIALPHQPASRIGQGTAIEQSRAAAQVYAAVLAAKQMPRDEQRAKRSMEDACRMKELAERAFFRYARGGSQVTGPTVHLARELARCWGNIDHGVSELRRDDEHGQSEMQAFAWDLETNTRSASIFIVPHKRDKRGGGEQLTDARDIYENNANAGARRLREAIFSLLPMWLNEQAQELCRQTLANGGGKPLQQRISEAIEGFSRLGVTESQLVDKVGRPVRAWTEMDLAPLGVIYRSIERGEVAKHDEFPTTDAVTAEEITGRNGREAPVDGTEQREEEAAAGEGVEQVPPQKLSGPQSKKLHALFREGGISSRDTRIRVSGLVVGREVASSNDLSMAEAARLIDQLEQWAEAGGLAETIAKLVEQGEQGHGEGGQS